MPEFILDHGTAQAARAFSALDPFVQGYIEAAFFTETGYPENNELESASTAEIAPTALADIIAECVAFQQAAESLLAQAYDREDYNSTQAGRDFWFTRCGHGVGYWDRKQLAADGLGDKLSEIARAHGCRYLDRGDDDNIYHS